jgi:hypothetical protein
VTVQNVTDLQTPIGEILQLAGSDGILLQPQGQSPYAIIPLDDEILDFLIERNPRLAEDCRKIRDRMTSGAAHTQGDVNALFGRNRTPSRS